MNLIENINEYQQVTFPTAQEAERAADALTNFVTSNTATIMTMVGPNRVVMWAEGVMTLDSRVLYLSAGAVTVLQGLHVVLPNPQRIAASQLPTSRALLLGDASDWNN